MSFAYKCDMCQKFLEFNANNKVYKEGSYMMRAEISRGSLSIHLCDKCFCSILSNFVGIIKGDNSKPAEEKDGEKS